MSDTAVVKLTSQFDDNTERQLTINNLNPSTININNIRTKAKNMVTMYSMPLKAGYRSNNGGTWQKISKAEVVITQDLEIA